MRKKLLIGSGILLVIVVTAGLLYIYQPHRDVQNATVDYAFPVKELVAEYLDDAEKANAKYLADDGQSKVIVIEGVISSTSTSADGRDILILKQSEQKAGMQCLFAADEQKGNFKVGDKTKVKGVLRAGPGYDEDLEMYENGYLEKCSIATND